MRCMTSPHRRARHRAGLGALSLLAALDWGAAACAGPKAVQVMESPTAHALPEADPGSRGMVQGPRTIGETEQVAVRLGRSPEGRVVVLQVLSPALTPSQEEALRRGLESGEWQREAPVAPDAESWIETVVRVRK
jgi:hypothetical protein